MFNKEVDFLYGIYLYYVEKMGNFQFVLVRIVVDYRNLLNLKSVVVFFDFVNMSSSEYSY